MEYLTKDSQFPDPTCHKFTKTFGPIIKNFSLFKVYDISYYCDSILRGSPNDLSCSIICLKCSGLKSKKVSGRHQLPPICSQSAQTTTHPVVVPVLLDARAVLSGSDAVLRLSLIRHECVISTVNVERILTSVNFTCQWSSGS